jgi:phosphatidylserine/phosphatidylglycerophosphate/cardiolipin synthase-like enzyme
MTYGRTMTSAMPELDLGARTVPGWYWLQSGTRRERFAPRPDAATGNLRHCFSYEKSQAAIKEAALDLIRGATEKIFLASFRFVDEDLRDALSRKAERLGGGVYVVTSIDRDRDFQDTIDFTASYEEDEEEDWYDEADPTATAQDINAEENKKHYRDLCASGVWVRGHPHFHAKFLVTDDRKALVSSANLESTALVDAHNRPGRGQGFDAVTGESGVVTTRPADAQLLGRFFARLWLAECTWDAPPGKDYQLRSRTPAPVSFEVGQTPPGQPGPIWTGGGDQYILAAIHQICALARNDLVLASFNTKGLEEHPDLLFEPVRAALDRGVRVRLLLRSRNSAEARKTAGTLAAWGVEVYGDDKTHAKCAIADGRHGAIFSANFDADHGIYSGVEMGMRLDGEPVLQDVVQFFDHCIARAPQRLAGDPSAAECTSLASRGLRDWPLPAKITVSCDDETWAALAATTGPVLYATGEDGNLTLHADGGRWTLASTGSKRRRLALVSPPTELEPGQPPPLLDEWLAPPRRARRDDPYQGYRCGLCTATLRRA